MLGGLYVALLRLSALCAIGATIIWSYGVLTHTGGLEWAGAYAVLAALGLALLGGVVRVAFAAATVLMGPGSRGAPRPMVVAVRRTQRRIVPPPLVLLHRGAFLLALLLALELFHEPLGIGDAGRVTATLSVGALALGAAFALWRRRRLLEDTPVSKIRSVALGAVEVAGRTRSFQPLDSPVTGTPCVYWRYRIEARTVFAGVSGWTVVEEADSSVWPFSVDDGTGSVAVDAGGAELDFPPRFRKAPRRGWRRLTGTARALLDARARDPQSEVRAYRLFPLRVTEWVLPEDAPVYVLGVAQTTEDLARARLRSPLPYYLWGDPGPPEAPLSERSDPMARYHARFEAARHSTLRLNPCSTSEAVEDALDDLGDVMLAGDPLDRRVSLYLGGSSERELLARNARRGALVLSGAGVALAGLGASATSLVGSPGALTLGGACAGLLLLWHYLERGIHRYAGT